MTMEMTAEELAGAIHPHPTVSEAIMEAADECDSPVILQASAGFTYSWSLGGAACSKVNPASIMLNGMTIDPGASYRVRFPARTLAELASGVALPSRNCRLGVIAT